MKQIVKMTLVGLAVAAAAWLCLTPTFVRPHSAATIQQKDAHLHLTPQESEARAQRENTAAQRCLGVFLVCLALWFTGAIPLAATALLGMGLIPLLQIMSANECFGYFGNQALFFILGVFLLAAAMISTGLSKRITLIALQRFDRSPALLVAGVTVSASFLSLWMPEHAVAAMIYPILIEVVDSLGLATGARYAKKLFLGLAWGSIIGGVGTFLGGARAPVAISFLKERSGETISFLDWMIAAFPVVVIMTGIALLTLRWRIKDDITDIRAATRMLDERVRRLGPMSAPEKRLALLVLATIVAWITQGEHIGLAVIATLSSVMLFVLRIVEWKPVVEYVNWNVLVMYGGAVALGMVLTETQAMKWLADQVIDESMPKIVLLMLIVLATMALTESISNTAAVAILLPIAYNMGDQIGVAPKLMTLVVTIPAGLAFILPVSSPPNAISFSAGHYSVREVMSFGWPMTLSALVVLLGVISVWWGVILNVNAW